jgi:hypothetical protein
MSCILISCACNKKIEEKNLKLFKMNYTSCIKEASAAAAYERRRYGTPTYTTAASDIGTVTTQIGWNPGPSFCIRSWHMRVGERVKLKETYYGDSDIVVKAVVGDSVVSDRVERHEALDYMSMAAMIQSRGGLGRRDVDEAWPGKYDDDEADSSVSSEAASVAGPSKIYASEAGPSGINSSGAASAAGPSGINASEAAPVAGPFGNNASGAASVAGLSGINASGAASVAGSSGINASGAASVEVTGTGLVNGRPYINRLFIEQLFNSSDDSDDDLWDPDEGFHERCIDGKIFFYNFKHECTLEFCS